MSSGCPTNAVHLVLRIEAAKLTTIALRHTSMSIVEIRVERLSFHLLCQKDKSGTCAEYGKSVTDVQLLTDSEQAQVLQKLQLHSTLASRNHKTVLGLIPSQTTGESRRFRLQDAPASSPCSMKAPCNANTAILISYLPSLGHKNLDLVLADAHHSLHRDPPESSASILASLEVCNGLNDSSCTLLRIATLKIPEPTNTPLSTQAAS